MGWYNEKKIGRSVCKRDGFSVLTEKKSGYERLTASVTDEESSARPQVHIYIY